MSNSLIPSQCKDNENLVNSLKLELATAQTNLQQQKGSQYWAERVKDLLQQLLHAQTALSKSVELASIERWTGTHE
jgi:hypothetical protein